MQRQRFSPGAKKTYAPVEPTEEQPVPTEHPGEDPEYRIDLEYRIDQAIKRAEAISTIGRENYIWKLERRGDWLWLYGNTWPIKDQLKAAGFEWSKGHTNDARREYGDRRAGCYIWKPEEYGKWKRRSHTDDDQIRAKYGSKEVL